MSKGRRKVWNIFSDIAPGLYTSVAIGSFVLVLAIWTAASYGGMVNPTFLPKPSLVFTQFFSLLNEKIYWHHIGISVFRVLAGFLLACVIGIPLGIFAGTFRVAEAFIEPMSEFIRYMPAVAFIPLIWAGIGEWAKILVIFIGCFFQLVLMVAADTRKVPVDLVQAAYTLGANRRRVIDTIIIPALGPHLMTTLRLTLGWAWTYLVVAELVAVNSGLGYAIMKAQRFLNTDQIFVGIIIIGLLGLLSDRLFSFANKRFFPWL
jgi:NitT/TauT family transport system permease protein